MQLIFVIFCTIICPFHKNNKRNSEVQKKGEKLLENTILSQVLINGSTIDHVHSMVARI